VGILARTILAPREGTREIHRVTSDPHRETLSSEMQKSLALSTKAFVVVGFLSLDRATVEFAPKLSERCAPALI
jgi:hypothetical protein